MLDDLSTGVESFVAADVPLVRGSVDDPVAVEAPLQASASTVSSTSPPSSTPGCPSTGRWRRTGRNVCGTVTLLGDAGLRRRPARLLIERGVFGTPDVDQVTEETPHAPESPYGASKSMAERIIIDTVAVSPFEGNVLALLQRRRLVVRGHLGRVAVQPVPSGHARTGRGPRAVGLWYGLPDPGRLVHPATTSTSATSRWRTSQLSRPSRAGVSLRPRTTSGAGTASSVLEIIGGVPAGDRDRLRAGAAATGARRPGAHRRVRPACRSGHRLADAAQRRRHGVQRLGLLAQGTSARLSPDHLACVVPDGKQGGHS